jgi:2-dehydropantoate 2-reductase
VSKKIAILGAGAIGSSVGGLLRRAGHEVLLIGRGPQVEAIRANGLHVDGVLGSFTVQVDATEKLETSPDLAFVTVKSQDLFTILTEYKNLLSDVSIVLFQNGVRSDEIVASVLPKKERIASVVVNIAANFLTPGEVTIVDAHPLVTGRPFAPNDAALLEIAAILRDALPVVVSNNIRGAHWMKLLVNLNNALLAVTNLSSHDVYRDAYLTRLAILAMREGIDAIDSAGIALESLPSFPIALARMIRLVPLALAGHLLSFMVRRQETRWPLLGSTLQSLRRGRPTEVDYLNGEVVRLGRQVNVPTPINLAMVELVHQVESTGRFLSTDEIQRAIESDVGCSALAR